MHDFAVVRVPKASMYKNDFKEAIYGMAVADLDNDGWHNVVVVRSDAPGFVMFNRPFKK
jgi:hypothetical protein